VSSRSRGAGGARTHDPGIMSQAPRVSAMISSDRSSSFLHVRRLSQSARVRGWPLVARGFVPTLCRRKMWRPRRPCSASGHRSGGHERSQPLQRVLLASLLFIVDGRVADDTEGPSGEGVPPQDRTDGLRALLPGETVLGELPALAPALPADLTVEKLAGRTTGSIAGSLQAAAPVITAPAVRRR
jgi:hypothetical protein